MEGNRKRNTLIQLSVNNNGIALVQAIFISVLALVVLGGLYLALTKFLSSSQTIKTYASVRDAAIGGIEYGVVILNTYNPCNMEPPLAVDKVVCFDGQQKNWVSSNFNPIFNPIILKFKIYGNDKVYENNISLCISGFKVRPGTQISGVAYSKKEGQCEGNLYTMIISKAKGPNNTQSIIEATYLP
mgnify:CR=1 FL=1